MTLRCQGCRKQVGPEAKTTDGSYWCEQCLRATAVWPTGTAASGRNIYGGGKA